MKYQFARHTVEREEKLEVHRSSAYSVPSLSKTAMRSAGGTKLGEPAMVTSATKAVMECFALPSFHDGSGSRVWAVAKPPKTRAKPRARTASRPRFIDITFLLGQMIPSQLTSKLTGWRGFSVPVRVE